MKVYIDPQTDVDYSAFYIQGLYEVFEERNVKFNTKYFKDLTETKKLRFVITKNKDILKYIIDWGDDNLIDESDYSWCDYYGKVNFNSEKTLIQYCGKIVRLAPGFGIKLWNFHTTIYHSIINLIRVGRHTRSVKKFVAKYYKQYNHLAIDNYKPYLPKLNYVYSINTLWNSNEWINNDDTVNQYRANFINACKSSPVVDFEGGFVYSHIKNENPKFSTMIIDLPWIPKKEYIAKIKESVLVFNTPAWALCHGWKLGEYLAMGKAIISTPILNELPAPLEHGKHIHIVSGEENDIKAAVSLITSNKDYRNYLEKNAYEYYLKYVSPTQSIRLLTNHQH